MHNGYSATFECPGNIDFDIHGVVGIRLIDPSPRDFDAACKLLGQPSRLPLTMPDITVRFVKDLPVREMRFLGTDGDGFTGDAFFLLEKGTRRVRAQIPFDRIGEPCEIVCTSRIGSVPLLIPIVGLAVLKKGCIPIHASAVVYDGVGILMAGWAHCGKTSALLGFASKGAEYVGEEWVLLGGNDQRMHGIVKPLELTHRQVVSLPHRWSAVNFINRCVFGGIGVLCELEKMIRGEAIQSNFLSRNLQRVSAGVEDRLRRAIEPSAIFQDRIRSAGSQVDKVFIFLSREENRIDVEPISPFEMARCLTFLVQHELSPLLGHYCAYRFAFPGRRNEFIESTAEYSLAILTRALHGKATYIVRLPYPHVFPELLKAIEPYCKPTAAPTAESIHALA